MLVQTMENANKENVFVIKDLMEMIVQKEFARKTVQKMDIVIQLNSNVCVKMDI
jgi:hypothetical protein